MTHTVETIEYRGLTIDVNYDEDASNPIDDFDEIPFVTYAGDGRTFINYNDRNAAFPLDYLPALSRDEIKNNIGMVKTILDVSALIYATTEERQYGGDSVDMINELIAAKYNDESDTDKFDVWVDVLKCKGIAAYTRQIHGFSQGDWGIAMAIATPEWLKLTGVTDPQGAMEHSIDLYEHWAFGSCYCWNVERIDESCAGYYGSDHNESGLLDAAKESIDHYIETNGHPTPVCPACDSEDVVGMATIIFESRGIKIDEDTGERICRECDHEWSVDLAGSDQ